VEGELDVYLEEHPPPVHDGEVTEEGELDVYLEEHPPPVHDGEVTEESV
jgi:hypothetical protein